MTQQVASQFGEPPNVPIRPAIFDLKVASLHPTSLAKSLCERGDDILISSSRSGAEVADAPGIGPDLSTNDRGSGTERACSDP